MGGISWRKLNDNKDGEGREGTRFLCPCLWLSNLTNSPGIIILCKIPKSIVRIIRQEQDSVIFSDPSSYFLGCLVRGIITPGRCAQDVFAAWHVGLGTHPKELSQAARMSPPGPRNAIRRCSCELPELVFM